MLVKGGENLSILDREILGPNITRDKAWLNSDPSGEICLSILTLMMDSYHLESVLMHKI